MNSECSICLSIISNDNYCITNCNHTYCYNCLNGWFEKKKISCPNCRENIKSFSYNNENTRVIYIDNTHHLPVVQQTNNLNTIIINRYLYNFLKFTSILSGLFLSMNIFFLIK